MSLTIMGLRSGCGLRRYFSACTTLFFPVGSLQMIIKCVPVVEQIKRRCQKLKKNPTQQKYPRKLCGHEIPFSRCDWLWTVGPLPPVVVTIAHDDNWSIPLLTDRHECMVVDAICCCCCCIPGTSCHHVWWRVHYWTSYRLLVGWLVVVAVLLYTIERDDDSWSISLLDYLPPTCTTNTILLSVVGLLFDDIMTLISPFFARQRERFKKIYFKKQPNIFSRRKAGFFAG